MSPKNLRVPLLGACLVALALVAMPLGTAPDMDNGFDVAARAEMGKQGREVQLTSKAVRVGTGRAFEVASKAVRVGTGRSADLPFVTLDAGRA